MDCFLPPWNNTHNFTVLAAISPHLWCRFQEKLTWLRQKASAVACYHIICVCGIFEAFSAMRDSIWIWIMTLKNLPWAFSCVIRDHMIHCIAAAWLLYCSGSMEEYCFICERISVSSHSLFQLWVCVFVCISVDANTCQISIWVKNWLQLIRNLCKLPKFVFFFHLTLHLEPPLTLSKQLLLHIYTFVHFWTFVSISSKLVWLSQRNDKVTYKLNLFICLCKQQKWLKNSEQCWLVFHILIHTL